MKHELFSNMQKQMTPSSELRASLTEKLARPAKKRSVPWKKYTALAACAAVMVTMCGAAVMSDQDRWNALVSRFMKDHPDAVYQGDDPYNSWFIVAPFGSNQPLHSYVTVEGLTSYVQENTTTATGGEGGEGDRDMGMTPEDLASAMLDVGYTQEEIDEYQSIGYQMTWTNWWKFVHQQENSEGDAPFNLDNLKTFSQKELYVHTGALPAPNTGDLPGGAYVGDVPVQAGAEDYQRLMDQFNGEYPDWYGGAYLDESGRLVVQLVSGKDPGDKSLELQVLDWTGSDTVMFSSCKYSLAFLLDLQKKVCDALYDMGLDFGCGTDEELNRLDLTLSEATEAALALLAELDPDDDAIYVQVGRLASFEDASGEAPAVHHVMPGGVPILDDEDLIADEPVYDGSLYDLKNLPQELPEQKQPAFEVQSAPNEDRSTPSYDPGR